ncbi:MAG: M20 family metallopeptidase [Planctomycetes bacterium]|nr:M20 family metallopeptidase [Planctomycetota bacterium]MBM4079761.1 M20 family metallopeptidase [Planctomycetota bacterium]MBM4084248.1 M20 family metallopeptidase [Planctomycetota bacterium]
MDRTIADAIDRRRDEIIAFTQQLVQTPSETPSGNEIAVAKVIRARMEALGVTDIEVRAKKADRPNLLGRVRFSKPGKALIFNAHTDTKDVGDRTPWTVDPFSGVIKDGYLYGRGAADMKAALAAMLYAAVALKAAKPDLGGEILLMFVADEEGGSVYGSEYLARETPLKADAAIIGEPCGIDAPWDCLHISHRGVFCFKIKVFGTQMHSSMSDIRPSVNACVKLAEVLTAFAREFRPTYKPHPLYPQGPTVNLAVLMKGGVFYGVYPGYAEFCTDVRIIPGMTKEQIVADLMGFVEKLRKRDPKLRVEVDPAPRPLDWVPAIELSPDEPVVKCALAAAEEVLGFRPKLAGLPGGTDARCIYIHTGIPVIPALGPGMLEICHGPNERVPVEDIVKAAQIYALAAANFLRHG